jgi:hypothetical protein
MHCKTGLSAQWKELSHAEPDPDFANARYGQYTLEVSHWLYRSEAQPFAKLLVKPEDFPFLDCVWGYDADVLSRRIEADSIAGWPFLEDAELYPILPDKRFRSG